MAIWGVIFAILCWGCAFVEVDVVPILRSGSKDALDGGSGVLVGSLLLVLFEFIKLNPDAPGAGVAEGTAFCGKKCVSEIYGIRSLLPKHLEDKFEALLKTSTLHDLTSIFSFPAPASLAGLTTMSPNKLDEEVVSAAGVGVGATTSVPKKSAAGSATGAGTGAGVGAARGAGGATVGAGAADFKFIPPNMSPPGAEGGTAGGGTGGSIDGTGGGTAAGAATGTGSSSKSNKLGASTCCCTTGAAATFLAPPPLLPPTANSEVGISNPNARQTLLAGSLTAALV